MATKYQSFPNEAAARNASRQAMGKNHSRVSPDVTEYLWEVYEGEDGQWHMVVLDNNHVANWRSKAHTPAELAAMSDIEPARKVEVII